jgi:hypothetical protein
LRSRPKRTASAARQSPNAHRTPQHNPTRTYQRM